ncbi:MAG TPA: YceD family protein, partial [Xanthobacteraceae bacterium]|nr:YceD family protein [Xanthobacteraceae bacterium]
MAGELNGAVGQVCVVTLDPIDNVISEKMDVDFLPASAAAHARTLADAVGDDGDDPPELLVEGTVDLGALAVEFLILSLDPYPRKPGAEFVAPDAETTDSGPFAALA